VKFSKKKTKTPFVVSCPEIQCSQKLLLRILGVKEVDAFRTYALLEPPALNLSIIKFEHT